MDPYLESPKHWSDFHAHFVTMLANAVNDLLPDNYIARMNEHVMKIAPTLWSEPDESVFVPDVTVVSNRTPAYGGPSAALMPAPELADIARRSITLENVRWMDDHVETYIEVQRLPEQQVVTVVELLSPTNKYGEGRGIYMKKRREFLAQPVNVVELDLLRAGGRLEFGKPLPAAHYHAFISRAEDRPKTQIFSWFVHERLPVIPIPLGSPDPAILLDLSQPFSMAYDNGRYRKIVNYKEPPPPPAFAPVHGQWVAKTVLQSV
jgi:hypothetical protein